MHKIQNDKVVSLLEAGFSDKEAQVYLAVLEVGKGSVLDISKQARIDRTTTYRILQEMLNIPLVQKFKEEKKTQWAALNPRYLLEYVGRKKRAVAEVLGDLEVMYNLNEEKPKMTYFEGAEGLARLTESVIGEVKHRGELRSFSAPGAASGYYTTKRFLELADERVKKQIMSRILIPTVEGVPGYREGEDFKNWRHIKVVDSKLFPFRATINIWNNKISVMTTKSHPIAVVIESRDVAETMRSIFEIVWANS